MRDSPFHVLWFATAVCIVCSVLVAVSAVSLREKQTTNRKLDRQKTVLVAAGLIGQREHAGARKVQELFDAHVEVEPITLATGERAESDGSGEERPAPSNRAGLVRLPTQIDVYHVRKEGEAETLVLPMEGKGLWSTMRGFLALDASDLNTVRGIEFYEHGETPGLGGEIDSPVWKAGFRGRKAFDESDKPALRVARGAAGSVESAPHEVDALTGATLTARGVTNMLQFWLGDDGYGPLLSRLEQEGGAP